MDVAAVLLNYNSGALCVSAVQSLLDQRFAGPDGGPGTLQIVVVDNASPVDQRAELDPLRELGVELIYHDRNDGYSGGINLGLTRVEAEYVLIANPDILVLDDALERMLALLRDDPSVGAVGPRGFLDPGRFLLLPPNDLPTLSLHLRASLGLVHPGVAERAVHQRSLRFLKAWRAELPFEAQMVPGFAMLLPTALARQLGPFDERYPFYFEDADLCRRLRRTGRRIMVEPRAQMVHYYDQSARSVRDEVSKKFLISREYYYRKHYGRLGSWLFGAAERYGAGRSRPGPGRHSGSFEHLGAADRPLTIELPEEREFLFEITTDPTFLFCAGHLSSGSSITIGDSAWELLDPARWLVRLLDPGDLSLIRAVTFEKTTPAAGPRSWERVCADAASSRSA